MGCVGVEVGVECRCGGRCGVLSSVLLTNEMSSLFSPCQLSSASLTQSW